MDIRKILPPVEYLRACYDYDPSLGVLTWRSRPLDHFQGNTATQKYINDTYAGELVGLRDKGKSLLLTLQDKRYAVHRIIYKWVTGEEPPHIIDHKDGDYTNQQWDNLRPATAQQNAQNAIRRGYQITENGTFRVRLRLDFGTYKTEEEARARYEAVINALYGEFSAADRLKIVADLQGTPTTLND